MTPMANHAATTPISPEIRAMAAEFDTSRQRLVSAFIDLRGAGLDRSILEEEAEATANALRLVAVFGAAS